MHLSDVIQKNLSAASWRVRDWGEVFAKALKAEEGTPHSKRLLDENKSTHSIYVYIYIYIYILGAASWLIRDWDSGEEVAKALKEE